MSSCTLFSELTIYHSTVTQTNSSGKGSPSYQPLTYSHLPCNIAELCAQMSGVSLLGGISAYTRYSSVPSLVASFGIGTAMALSSMRIRDGMDYGLESAAGGLSPSDT
jgi:hypothetical protein